MAALEKIRVKFGAVVSIIIALALLSFIIDPGTLESAFQTMSSKYDVGKINGKNIAYSDFLTDVDRYTTINELISGSSVQSEQQRQQIQNAAWQELVDKYLFIKNANKAGIYVGKDELVDLTSGDMVSPILAQNPAFCDENGNFSKEAVSNFIQNIDSDQTGRLKIYWNYVQNTIYNQQYYAKYGSLFTQSNIQNPLMLKKAIEENNTTTNVDFVMVPVGMTADSTVTVSDAEIKDYYEHHKDFFKQKANRDIEYVVFEVTPSEADIAEVNNKMAEIYPAFSAVEGAKDMKAFLSKNSDKAYSEYWYKENELNSLSSELGSFVNEAAVNAVSPIVKSGNNYYAAKVMAIAPKCDNAQVRIISARDESAISDSLVTTLRLSEPQQLSESRMIPGCESLLDPATPLNEPMFIQTAQYGQLLAEVVSKAEPVVKKQVAILQKEVVASKVTINDVYAKANNFSALANGKYADYKKAVDTLGVYSHPMNNVLESTSNYGAIDQAKEVTRWIFDNKKGKVSNIITVNNNYFFVVAIKDIHKEGVASLKEVSSSISQRLLADKRVEAKAEEVKAKIAGMTDLQQIAEALGTSVSNQDALTFASMGAQGLDPKFIGAASVAKEGVISGPIAGTIGVYVFKVNSRETGSYYTEDDARNYAVQINQYNSQMVLPVMEQNDKVVDNRARFF